MKQDNLRTILIIAVIIGVLILGVYGKLQSIKESKKIRVGFIGLSQEDENSYNGSIKKAIKLAQKDLESDDIEVVYKEASCDEKNVTSIAKELIKLSRASVILEGVCPKATLALAALAEQNKIVLMSFSVTPDVFSLNNYTFKIAPNNLLKGEFAADLVYNQGYKKLAILYSNEDYATQFKDGLEKEFKGDIVSKELFEHRTNDTRVQLARIKNTRPDAIYIITDSPQSAVTALKQIKAYGIKAAVFGSEGLLDKKILKAGNAAENIIIIYPYPGSVYFQEHYTSIYNETFSPLAAAAYDSFATIKKVASQGAYNGQDIQKTLRNTEFEGVSGHISFDENGNIPPNYDVYQVKNNEFILIK